jgi:hypothetical protein
LLGIPHNASRLQDTSMQHPSLPIVKSSCTVHLDSAIVHCPMETPPSPSRCEKSLEKDRQHAGRRTKRSS